MAHGVRDEMIEIAEVMLGYAVAVGDDRAAAGHRSEVDRLKGGERVLVHHSWQVGHPDPNSGPFWRETDDRPHREVAS